MLTTPLLATCNVGASPGGEIIWTQTGNPTSGYDYPYAVTADGSGIYVAGFEYSPIDTKWRIEKRALTDGSLIWSQTNNPSGGYDAAQGIAVDSSGVYIVGYDISPGNNEWRIEKRSLTTGALIASFGTGGVVTSNPSTGDDKAYGIAVDVSGIYIVGFDSSTATSEWRIEKRSLTDGLLIWLQTIDASGGSDVAYGIAIDGTGIYVVGQSRASGSLDLAWRMEKRTLDSGALTWSQTSNPSTADDEARGAAVDVSGVYIVGRASTSGYHEWRIEKRSLTAGAPMWQQTSNPSASWDETRDVAVDSSGIYVVGWDESQGSGNWQWRIEKRGIIAGELVWLQTGNPSSTHDGAEGVTVDSSGIYVVGFDNTPGNPQWKVEKRELGLASKLSITVHPSSVTAGSWTTKYTVERQDSHGNPVITGYTAVNLASTSTGTAKKFSDTAGGAPLTSVTITDGSSSKDFYYYDEQTGTCSISVAATGLTGDSKSLTVNPRSACVIATAAYGSEMAPEVAYMRHVRDDMIGSNEVGRLLVNGWNTFYYSWSPPIAEFIGRSETSQTVFRILLMPLVLIIHSTACIYALIVFVSASLASVLSFLFAAVSSITVYAAAPVILLRFIHRKWTNP
jgi:hypothetical protein